jgi:hypothetical protein
VIKEVVPLSEVQLAPGKVTFQNFDTSMGPGILVFEHAVSSCNWYLNFFDSDFIHVQGGPVLYMNWSVWGDLLAQLVVRDLVTDAGVGVNIAVHAFFINI